MVQYDLGKYDFEIKTAFAVIIIIFCSYLFTRDESKDFDQIITVIENDEYYGIVNLKFIDSENHNSPTIVLSNGKHLTFYDQQFDIIEIGDSLSKKLKTTIVKVFKKNTITEINQKEYILEIEGKYLKR